MIMRKIGFDTEAYLKHQSEQILERVNEIDKLYVEFGGKLLDDKHAARVLPGFDEDAKIKLLMTLQEKTEIIICVNSQDIEQNKVRGDYGITYSQEVLRLIDEYHARGILVNSVLLTRYKEERAAKSFMTNLINRGISVHTHYDIQGYPTDVDYLFSENGFARNEYIETTRPIVVVTAPGAGSGKLATCLNQLYHEQTNGVEAGYAKFETFPVWDLPLKHPVNVAYEAATADLLDVNVIDDYHYEAYGEYAVNYNRDVKMFPVIKKILSQVSGDRVVYKSPTDMGVNCLSSGIVDDDVIKDAANQEIVRRALDTEIDFKKGTVNEEVRERMRLILEESNLSIEDRPTVVLAREYGLEVQERFGLKEAPSVIAMQLADDTMVTGRTSSLMDSAASSTLNALKALAGINDQIDVIAPSVLEVIKSLNIDKLDSKSPTLSLSELLIALAISAVTNPTAELAYDQLENLRHAQAHATSIISDENINTMKRLGIDVTCDSIYTSTNLFYQ